jgi:hypothetical protein
VTKHHYHPHAIGSTGSWSIGSNGLTPAGQSDLLKQLGRQLQTIYQNALKEPAPDRIKQLLEKLEEDRTPQEDEPL